MTELRIYLFMLVCIIANCDEDSNWLKCKPRPGCSLARCDPRPGRWFENNPEPDDYAILCQRDGFRSSDNSVATSELLREVTKLEGRLERSENEADEMKHKIKDLEERNSELLSQIKDERAKSGGLEERVRANFKRWKRSESVVAEIKADLISKENEIRSLKQNLLFNDCGEAGQNIKGDGGVFQIFQNGKLYKVYCDTSTDGGRWVVFQRRMDGSVDFYRTWEEYASGFGNKSGEFWLGLETIHQLTKDGEYELRVDLTDWDGSTAYARYETFSMSGRSDGYKLTVEGYSGTAGHSMGWNNRKPFTTKDNNLDTYSVSNCAVRARSAWWYNACSTSNLNGKYDATPGNGGGIWWGAWKGSSHLLKGSEMKFRKK